MAKKLTTKQDSAQYISKGNALIMASYSLTVKERRLVLGAIGKAQAKKTTLRNPSIEITLTAPEYSLLCGITVKSAQKALKDACEKLYERTVLVDEDGSGKREEYRWIQKKATYASGKVSVKFSEDISNHIRNIVSKQTTYSLIEATQLGVEHASHFFEMLQMSIDKKTGEGTWDVGVDELKELLALEGCYQRWADFKIRIVEKCCNEINNKTSFTVEWGVSKKEGKKIDRLFFITTDGDQLPLSLG